MKDLVFFTDRYPYNNSEAFIENEIQYLADAFDRVTIIPCGLMVDTTSIRQVPSNVNVIEPACSDNIFVSKPSTKKKVLWGMRHLLKWYVACLFDTEFYKEMQQLIGNKQFSVGRGLKVFRTLAPAIRNRFYYKNALKDIQWGDVYVYSYWIEPTVLFANQIIRKIPKRVICRTHRWDLYSEENSYNYLPLQRRTIEFVDILSSISRDGVNYLMAKYPELKNRIRCSYLGTTDYGRNPDQTESVFRIVSCSNMIPVKRLDLLIESLSNFVDTNACMGNIEWIHFGSGQYREQVEALAKEKLAGKLKYIFKGQVSNQDIISYYRSTHVDVFINVSSSEGIPVSIIEAASFGIPIIATDVGGTRELVQTNVNGYLLEKNYEQSAFTDALRSLIIGKAELTLIRDRARLVWEEKFCAETNYKNFIDGLTR